jgi:hypothetical protein
MQKGPAEAEPHQPASRSAAQHTMTKQTIKTAVASSTEPFARITRKPAPRAIAKASSISPQPISSNFNLSRHNLTLVLKVVAKKKPRAKRGQSCPRTLQAPRGASARQDATAALRPRRWPIAPIRLPMPPPSDFEVVLFWIAGILIMTASGAVAIYASHHHLWDLH